MDQTMNEVDWRTSIEIERQTVLRAEISQLKAENERLKKQMHASRYDLVKEIESLINKNETQQIIANGKIATLEKKLDLLQKLIERRMS